MGKVHDILLVREASVKFASAQLFRLDIEAIYSRVSKLRVQTMLQTRGKFYVR